MFGATLKKLRLQKRLSQEQLANKMYVVRQTVSKWETGLSAPKAEELKSLSSILKVPLDQLLGIHDEFVNEHHAVSRSSKYTTSFEDNCLVAARKEEMIAGITNHLEEMNESGVIIWHDFIMSIPIKERWMASTSKERIAELDAIATQREQDAAQKKERAAKEAEQKESEKREQIYRDYARMFNAIKTVDIPTRYDLTVGELQAIDFVCGGIRRYFPEYAYSVAGAYFKYGFVKGKRYEKACAKKKQK